MRNKTIWKWQSLLWMLLVVAGVCWTWRSLDASPRPLASVVGSVVVKRKNLRTTTVLQSNDKLYQGDVVATSYTSGASVRFSDGSKVDVGSKSTLEITRPVSVGSGKVLFRALKGRMTAHLTPGRVIATRTAMVRVKGTIVSVFVEDDGTTTLSVLQGSAEFFNTCGEVLVPAGAESTARPGNAPTQPVGIPDLQELWRQWRAGSGAGEPLNPGEVAPVNAMINDVPLAQVEKAVLEFNARPKVTVQSNAQLKPKGKSSGCGTGPDTDAEAITE